MNVYSVVFNINGDLEEHQNIKDFWIPLLYTSDGDNELIEYLGFTIWDSQNSELCTEEQIRDKINNINFCIGKIKL